MSDVNDLIRRLRGEYRIPITDGLGAAGGDEPNNPNEFVRTFDVPPVNKEAAALIERQAARIAELEDAAQITDIMVKTAIAERIEANGRAEAAERELAVVRERLALSAKSLLLGKMEEISEDLWCAGWLIGLEFSLWRAVTDGPFDYGLGRISQEDCDLLKSLSDDAGGWWRLDINSGRTFTPMNEWLQLVQALAQKDGGNG